MLLLLL
jgi:hypothetical protein